jgi:hypothetical protein
VELFDFNVPVATTLTAVSLPHTVSHDLMVTLRAVKLRSAAMNFSRNASCSVGDKVGWGGCEVVDAHPVTAIDINRISTVVAAAF